MGYSNPVGARIRTGDIVVIVTDGMTTQYYQQHCQEATVINTPQGPGDLWQFQTPDGTVIALNPYHSSFVRIEKPPRS